MLPRPLQAQEAAEKRRDTSSATKAGRAAAIAAVASSANLAQPCPSAAAAAAASNAGTSDKFYRITLAGLTVTSSYGKCGAAGASTSKDFATPVSIAAVILFGFPPLSERPLVLPPQAEARKFFDKTVAGESEWEWEDDWGADSLRGPSQAT